MKTLAAVLVLAPAVAAAAPQQAQIDGGLSVIGPAYERALTDHVSLGVEAFVFGTYFLPWFDLGLETKGFGSGIRPTWFREADQHGLYVAPYLRGVVVDDEQITGTSGLGFTAGFFVGYAFRLSSKIDLRLGGGVQYIHAHVETDNGKESFETPFAALDALVGYRL